MDEAKVAAQVAQNIPKEEPSAPPAPDIPEEQSSTHSNPINLEDPTLNLRISDYFELPRTARYSDETQQQLRMVLDWASEVSQSSDMADILSTIHAMERELGITFKPNRLEKVYRYTKIQRQLFSINKEMELLRD